MIAAFPAPSICLHFGAQAEAAERVTHALKVHPGIGDNLVQIAVFIIFNAVAHHILRFDNPHATH